MTLNTCTCDPYGPDDPHCPFTLRVLKAVAAYSVLDPYSRPVSPIRGVGSDGGPEESTDTGPSGPSTSSEVTASQ